MLDRGYREFVVDLADCVMMDSTFMGTMASVALRLKELGRGHLHVVHCADRSRELLFGLGLDQYSIFMPMVRLHPNVRRSSAFSGTSRERARKRSKRKRCWKRTRLFARRPRKISFALRTFS